MSTESSNPSNELYNKLSFNGYHVTWWSHETREIETTPFPTVREVMTMGWSQKGEPFPSPKEFADDLYNVYGDTVGLIVDNEGVVLLDNMVRMKEHWEESRY